MTGAINPISDEDRWAVATALLARYDISAIAAMMVVGRAEPAVAEKAMSGHLESPAWWRAALYDEATKRLHKPKS